MPPEYPEVYDQFGRPRTFEWLTQEYWPMYVRIPTSSPYYRLVRIDVTSGPAVCQVQVRGIDSKPMQLLPVAFYWQDAPQLPPGHYSGTIWHPNAIVQYTGPNGDTGFGLGDGSYVRDPRGPGPHDVWVLSQSGIDSDCITGLGMKMGTNHEGPLHLVFALTNETPPGGQPPDPEPPDPSDTEARLAKLERWAARLSALWEE